MTPRDSKTEIFEVERPRLLRLAYRMLGSFSEAEDVIQDGWLRWTGVSQSVDAPAAYLTRIITRLCLDRLKSARARRETYVGPWLPDPLVEAVDPVETIADDVTVTLMLAMERLSPLERAAFLLHDIFEVPLKEVATTLDREPAAVRQLASRARRNVKTERSRYSLCAAEADRIARAFFEAAHGGDTASLAGLLARDVEIHADGGGRVSAFRNIVRGLDNALRLFSHASRNLEQRPTLVRTAIIDGLPGYVSYNPDGRLQTTALDLEDGRIRAIYIVRNPDKLTHVTAGEPLRG